VRFSVHTEEVLNEVSLSLFICLPKDHSCPGPRLFWLAAERLRTKELCRIVDMNSSATIRLPLDVCENSVTGAAVTDPVVWVSDERLLVEICHGGREALGILFRRHASLVRAVALRILRNAAEADDLVQDIFLLIHRFAKTFDSSKASVQFWIVQMTYRRAISRRQYLNSRHFYTRVELDEQTIQPDFARVEPSNAQLDRRLAQLDLQKIFGSLSEDQQKTLRLHFIEGYTLDEIAKLLGQTKGNIRNHSFRGLERLRKLIFDDELAGTGAV
jgi:RNA polymerase sigma-70 factor, ECF subfamily